MLLKLTGRAFLVIETGWAMIQRPVALCQYPFFQVEVVFVCQMAVLNFKMTKKSRAVAKGGI